MMSEEFRAGHVWLGDGADFHSADIDGKREEQFGVGPWHYGMICCYGKGEDGAKALRDRVLAALTLPEQPRPVDDVEMRDIARRCADWLEACLKCEAFGWDADQREAAEDELAEARAALGHKDRGGK